MISVEMLQIEEISGLGKNGGRKGVGSAICQRRVNRRDINEEELI